MKSIITTDLSKCVGCNRCVRSCPIDEANVVQIDNGVNHVGVDNTKCITCGACLDACHHDSRLFEDDTMQFFSDLKQGVSISLFVAPAVRTNFDNPGRLYSWFRQQGVKQIHDVSLGADICTWAHIRHIQKHGASPIISQPCPAIVNYILVHKNELIKYLSPIHSPMLCTATYMRKYAGVNHRIAALSPCIAKTHEFDATGAVHYNITFKNLLRYIREYNISFPMQESGFDHYDSGLGSLYPMPGGLKENVEHYIGKSLRVDKSEGQKVVYKALEEYAKQPKHKLPVLFDVLNCAEGCNLGTGCQHEADIFEINTTMNDLRQEVIAQDKRKYLDELFVKFDKTLRLEDFYRRYDPIPARSIPVSQNTIDKAFDLLKKFTEKERVYDCGACGNDTCLEMAKQIAKGINSPSNCLDKSHKDMLFEHERAIENISSFDTVLKDTTKIKELTENIMVSINDITEAITAYNKMIKEIEKIAMQVNIIAVNASIESARAGEHGKAFAVVAGEVRNLAQKSNASAQQTKEASVKATSAIDSVNDMMNKINQSVSSSYDNVKQIAIKNQEIIERDKLRKTLQIKAIV